MPSKRGEIFCCVKSLTQALVLNLAFRSFLWHRLPLVENTVYGEAKFRRTSECRKLFGLNPAEASPWSYRVLSTLQSLASPRQLSQPVLWTSPSEVCSPAVPMNVICFVPAWGIIPNTSGLDLSVCVCEVIHSPTVMHYELWKSWLVSACVLLLGSLTQARPVNGLDGSFSFRLQWDSLPTYRNPQGVLITSI